MIDYSELKRLAEAFPADLDWDSNTEPFFNGPSGESLGGGADGTYTVYGKPFRIEDEDYDYDGPTYVERCGVDFAKFMVSARDGVLALIAENERLVASLSKPDDITAEPASDYDALRKQFMALRSLANSNSRMVSHWRNRCGIETRETLLANADNVNAERDTNQMLTKALLAAEDERDQLKAENERMRLALKSAEDAMWKSESNMDNEAADIRDLLAAMDQGERSDG